MTPKVNSWILTANPDSQGQAKIAGRAIYILPTRAGFWFGVAIFAMLLGSLNYSSNIGLAFTFLFGSILMVGMVHTWRNLVKIQVETVDAPPIFVGNPTSFQVRLTEIQGLSRASLVVTAEDTFRLWNVAPLPSATCAHAVDLDALSTVDVELYPTPQQRGKYSLGILCIASTFPLGLFRAWAYADTTASVLVYPAPITARSWRPAVHFVPAIQGGGRGVGVEDFVGLRAYRSGDSLRSLDWKSLAKGREPITRQFGGDRQEQILLDWDAVGPGDVEERLSRLCGMILYAAAQNLSYSLRLPNCTLPTAAGEAHKHRCLAQLALFPSSEALKIANT